MAETLILIRHGEVETRYQKKLLGATDASLSPVGVDQAKILSRFLPTLKPDICVISPMKRCLETAQPSRERIQVAFRVEDDFREADFGDWETMGFDEIAVNYPKELASMAKFDPDFVFPNGEPMKTFQGRIKNAVNKWTKAPEKTVAVFTHAGVIRFAICGILNINPRHHVAFEISYASMVVIKLFGEKGVLQAIIPVSTLSS